MAMNTTPTSTINTFLMLGTLVEETVVFNKLCDIKDYPDLIGNPEALDTTSLSDSSRTYVQGLKNNEQLSFTANYTEDSFNTISNLEGKHTFSIDFGTDGADGRFVFGGYISVSITGHGVNEVREMQITITPTTNIQFIPTP